MSIVTQIPAAPPSEALAHFESILQFETDCSDVHQAIRAGASDFVLLDVREADDFAHGHIAGAINVPHGQIGLAQLDQYAAETIFVAYSDVPHCNAALRAAIHVAGLGRPVKILSGGITAWMEEGFPVEELRSEFD